VRTREELKFILDRVISEIRANPPHGPLLGEAPRGRPKSATCKRGHEAGRDKQGHCYECERVRKGRDGR
jgi:hypothetical protein